MSLGRKTMTAKLLAMGGNVAICLECEGKGFAGAGNNRGGRHCRRCPKCKGTGRVSVGSTKR